VWPFGTWTGPIDCQTAGAAAPGAAMAIATRLRPRRLVRACPSLFAADAIAAAKVFADFDGFRLLLRLCSRPAAFVLLIRFGSPKSGTVASGITRPDRTSTLSARSRSA